MTDVAGTWDHRFDRLADELAANVDKGVEVGAGFVVNIDGTDVVDLWAGWQDKDRTRPWTRDTIVNVWSSTKTVTSLAALLLIDRGELDPHAPVHRYWPEFAAGGKEGVLVRHLLSHTSGVPAFEQPYTPQVAYDLAVSTARLAAQPPWWTPGSASGYHASNYGHLIGEVVRRVSGRGLGQFVHDEIAGPLGADFQLGAAEHDWPRVAEIVPPEVRADVDTTGPIDEDSVFYKTLAGSVSDPLIANTPDWRRSENGAVNGHTNARAMALMLSALALDGVSSSGVRLLSPATIDLIFDEQASGPDLFLGLPLRWGIGFALPSAGVPFVRGERTCFWGGWGGSLIIMDLDRRLTISYMMNQMQPGVIGSDVSAAYVDTIYECLGATG
ncbi:serine hydrolase domain-containing protein [Dactylosporangium sp. CA-092794]|uniref:serine hydrolase domain-containing protein n=1 Tax=Dactylosporangium sp. CA-092794 TaxID=3239929 RepID=UPI003D93E0D5